MKILITGSEGFFGKHLTKHLEEYGHSVQGWDIQNGDDIFDPKIEEAIAACDVVVHLAAHTNVRYSFANVEEVIRTNTVGAGLIAHYCYRQAKRMIFASSIATTEREASPYAESKALAEDILKNFQNVTVFRFSNLIGSNMNERSGALLYWFLKGSHEGKITIDGDGTHERDFIHIRDVVDIVRTAIEEDWSGAKVDCVTGKYYSVKQMADMFAQYTGCKIEFGPAKPGPAKLYGDQEMLPKLYLKTLTTDVPTDIKEMIKDYGKNHTN